MDGGGGLLGGFGAGLRRGLGWRGRVLGGGGVGLGCGAG